MYYATKVDLIRLIYIYIQYEWDIVQYLVALVVIDDFYSVGGLNWIHSQAQPG